MSYPVCYKFKKVNCYCRITELILIVFKNLSCITIKNCIVYIYCDDVNAHIVTDCHLINPYEIYLCNFGAQIKILKKSKKPAKYFALFFDQNFIKH